MNKIRTIILLTSILLITGCSIETQESTCSIETQESTQNESSYLKNRIKTFVDKETCVEYFVSNGYYNQGEVTVKYNADGTLKINKKCLEEDNDE